MYISISLIDNTIVFGTWVNVDSWLLGLGPAHHDCSYIKITMEYLCDKLCVSSEHLFHLRYHILISESGWFFVHCRLIEYGSRDK